MRFFLALTVLWIGLNAVAGPLQFQITDDTEMAGHLVLLPEPTWPAGMIRPTLGPIVGGMIGGQALPHQKVRAQLSLDFGFWDSPENFVVRFKPEMVKQCSKSPINCESPTVTAVYLKSEKKYQAYLTFIKEGVWQIVVTVQKGSNKVAEATDRGLSTGYQVDRRLK